MKNFSINNYNNYFKFSFVRNPWSRAFSWYQNVMRDETHKKNLNIIKDLSFDDFLFKFCGKGMLRPQMSWLQDFQGDIKLDFIGKFENINNDFEYVCRRLEINYKKLEHKNVGSKLNYRDFYNSYTKKLVKDIYDYEIDYFKYTFGNQKKLLIKGLKSLC